MIFAFYSKVAVKLGEERYEFDRDGLMFSDAATIERTSGMAYDEWEYELNRGSILAKAALLHLLRKKAGLDVAFDDMEFKAADLEIVPLHEDGTEFTRDEVTEDVARRARERIEGNGKPGPTTAAEGSAAGQATPTPETIPGTSPSSPNGSASAPGSGNGSPGATSSPSEEQQTRF